jgi:hypothetical protein
MMKMKGWRLAAAFGLAIAVAGGAAAELVGPGKTAPAWSGKTLAGKVLKSTDLKGKVVVVNFFSYG